MSSPKPNVSPGAQSGILYVTMAPSPSLPASQFHSWYNNEHGPLRLRLPFITSGFRYHSPSTSTSTSASTALTPAAAPGSDPEWLALYDVADMCRLVQPAYTALRSPERKTEREVETMKQIAVGRRFYDLQSTHQSASYRPLEEVEMQGEENVLVARSWAVRKGGLEEFERWFAEEEAGRVQGLRGWRRTRRFARSKLEEGTEEGEEDGETEVLVLSEFLAGSGGFEEEKGIVPGGMIREERRRSYELRYTFGPAPRDLGSLEVKGEGLRSWVYSDAKTKTWPEGDPNAEGGRAAVESYVTTRDGAVLHYRLEGSGEEDAPLVVLVNSVLVEYGIWDEFVDRFLSEERNKRYRVLRYHARGRTGDVGSDTVTVDVLARDVVDLLNALRTKEAAAVVGVSLGGATSLCVALRYPERVGAFVACDTNSSSPRGNREAWGERIAVAEKEGSEGGLVGEQLAEMTVRRWLVEETYDGGEMEDRADRVKRMVMTNSLEGFKRSVEALYDYDLRPGMKDGKVRGAFLVGSGDGKLPAGMKEMAATYGGGGRYEVIQGAGHLPMVEKPKEVATFVGDFLADT